MSFALPESPLWVAFPTLSVVGPARVGGLPTVAALLRADSSSIDAATRAGVAVGERGAGGDGD